MGSIELIRVKIESYNSLGSGGGLVAKSCPTLATPWIVACQAPLSMVFSRQEYWSGLLFLSGDPPEPGIEPGSPALQADSLPSEPPGKYLSAFKLYFYSFASSHKELVINQSLIS